MYFFYVDNFQGVVYTLRCKHADVFKLLHHYKSVFNNWQQKLEINTIKSVSAGIEKPKERHRLNKGSYI